MCPDIDELLNTDASGPGMEASRHLRECGACASVVALASFRSVARSPSQPSDLCAELEPAITAMVAGTIHRLELGRLVQHLGECVECSDVASRLTFFRPELDSIPDPVPPEAHASAAPPADRAETTVIRRQPTTGGRNGLGSRARRALDELLPPRPQRLMWGAQMAAAACLAAVVGYALAREPAPIAASHDPVMRAAPAGGAEMGRALEHAAHADARARDAEARLAATEARLQEANRRLAELEPAPKPEPSAPKPGPNPPKPDNNKAPAELPPAPFAPSQVQFEPPTGPPSVDGAPGFLTLVCNPHCDDILVEGKSLGASPVVRVPMKPGPLRVQLRRKGFADKTVSVVIVAGQMTTQRVSMKSRVEREDDDAGASPGEAPARGAATAAIAKAVRSCGRSAHGDSKGSVTVTFAETGEVSSVLVAPWTGTPLAGCIASAVRGVKVAPFSGGPMTVSAPIFFSGPNRRDVFGERR